MVVQGERFALDRLVPRVLNIDLDCAEPATSDALALVCEVIAERLLVGSDSAYCAPVTSSPHAPQVAALAATGVLPGTPESLEAAAAELRLIEDRIASTLPATASLARDLATRLRIHAQLLRDEARNLAAIDSDNPQARVLRGRCAARVERAERAVQSWALDIVQP